MRRNWIRWLSTGIVLAIMIAIFILSSEEREQSESRSFPIGDAAMETGVFESALFNRARQSQEERGEPFELFVQRFVRKTIHFFEYFALGAALFVCIISWFGERKLNWLWSFLVGTLYAASDEWHQTMVPGRSGNWRDVGLDAAGAITGVLVVWVIVRVISHIRVSPSS